MSEIYVVLGDNHELIKEVEKSYESSEDYVRLCAIRMEMGELATKGVFNRSDSIKSSAIFNDNERELAEHVIKYLPMTKPNIVRQRVGEVTDKVIHTEVEQRSFGLCFVDKRIEQNNATLIVPRSRNKQAFIEVFDPDEI